MSKHASTEFHRLLREYQRAVIALADHEAQTSSDEVDTRRLQEDVLKKEKALDEFVAGGEKLLKEVVSLIDRLEEDQGYARPNDQPAARLSQLMVHHGYDQPPTAR